MENAANNFINKNIKGYNLLLTAGALSLIAMNYSGRLSDLTTVILLLPIIFIGSYKNWKAR